MKSFWKLALLSSLFAAIPAFAQTLCPGDAAQGGFNATYTPVPGATGPGGVCTAGGVQVSLANDQNGEGKLYWTPSSPGYLPGLTIGNLAGVDATLSNVSGGQPYFYLSFYDSAVPGDQLLFLEFQPTTVTGGTDMALDPTSTQFNVYDNTTNQYLYAGQADTNSLDGWISLDPSVANDAIASIALVNGLAGGCDKGGCPATFTADYVTLSETPSPTPEPASIVSLATGIIGMAGIVTVRRRKALAAA